jgi:exportin-2 (importin alpha re-exporter)
MRVIVTTRSGLVPSYTTILQHLVAILGEISKNPSNPKFNHFTFESISALVRFVTASQPSTLASFEAALFPPFHLILQQDVSEFTPFVFQILSQLLELHPAGDMPDSYKVLLPPLLTPTLWESRGNIPALVRLLRAFLSRGGEQIVAAGQVTPMLGIFQHLIQSKANDQYGFELLEALVESLPVYVLPRPPIFPFFTVLTFTLSYSNS